MSVQTQKEHQKNKDDGSNVIFRGRNLNDCFDFKIKCPFCRTDNTIPHNQPKIHGADGKCVICVDAIAENFLPTCGHVLCNECIVQIESHKDTNYDEDELSESNNNDDNNDNNDNALLPVVEQEAREKMGIQCGKIYVEIPVEMGNYRYELLEDFLMGYDDFLMGYDDWGQYGDRSTWDRSTCNRITYDNVWRDELVTE